MPPRSFSRFFNKSRYPDEPAMIVPRTRLLLWTSIIVLPFALAAGLERSALAISLSAIAGFAVLAVLDAVGSLTSLRGINLMLPLLTRMSRDRPSKVELRIQNQQQTPKTIRLSLTLPSEIHASEPDASIALPEGSEWSRCEWVCVPKKRGQFRAGPVWIEGTSPLGFWGLRRSFSSDAEIRVYPNLKKDRKDLAALFLRRGQLGIHSQRQLGRGRDFEKLREYVPGDSYEEIHWKATAKRGQPITKLFQVERTQEVYVVIDNSRLAGRTLPAAAISATRALPSEPEATTTLERFVTAALVLGLAAEQQGDLFGLVTFSDKIGGFVRARAGKSHYNACREALYTLQPQMVTPDFDEVCTFIRLRLRRRALVLFLTALDDPVVAENFVRSVDLIRRQHVIVVNMLQPAGVRPLFQNPNVNDVDELYEQLGGHLLWNKLRQVEKILQRRGVRFSMLSDERLSAQLVSEYLAVKQRQLL